VSLPLTQTPPTGSPRGAPSAELQSARRCAVELELWTGYIVGVSAKARSFGPRRITTPWNGSTPVLVFDRSTA